MKHSEKGDWWRCEHPERPTNAVVRWHYEGCQPSRFAVGLQRRLYPDDDHVRYLAERLFHPAVDLLEARP